MNNKSAPNLSNKLTKEQLISQLNLEHHFEGGYFRQTFKAEHRDQINTARGDRTIMTAIYYMLTDDNNIDHFHTFTSLLTPASTCEGIVFDQFHTALRGRLLFTVDYEARSPAAWFGRGLCLFDRSPC